MERARLVPALLGLLLFIGLSASGEGAGEQAQTEYGNGLSENSEDLPTADNQLTTVTYVGFAEFKTTIGSTVVVFVPRTQPDTPGPLTTRSGKDLRPTTGPVFIPQTTRNPVFIPSRTREVTTTKTLSAAANIPTKASQPSLLTKVEQISAVPEASIKQEKPPEKEPENVPEVIVPEVVVPEVVVPEVIVPEVSKPEAAPVAQPLNENAISDSITAFSTTRVFSTDVIYPTGLVTSIGGTVVSSGITTAYTTLFYGTFIKRRYAKVAKSTSSVYSNSVDVPAIPQPTSVVYRPQVTSELGSSVARAIGGDAAPQIIVADPEEAKAVLEKRKLETSTQPATAPALFSSQADQEEENAVLKTYFTTLTYFTTEIRDGTSHVKSSLSTTSRVTTVTLPKDAVTTASTYTILDTETSNGQKTIITRFDTKLKVLSPTTSSAPTEEIRLVTKTYFTTYTYFTTSYVGESSVIQSRLVVSSNVVTSTSAPALQSPVTTPKVTPQSTAQLVASSPVSSSPVAVLSPTSEAPVATPLASPSLDAVAPSASHVQTAPLSNAAVLGNKPELAAVPQHKTGLLSSIVSSAVQGGVTTVYSTGFLGTVVNGTYVNVVRSTTSIIGEASSALPKVVLPSSALPSSALPSSVLLNRALLSSALPSSALPSSAAPNRALPSSSLPNRQLPQRSIAPAALQPSRTTAPRRVSLRSRLNNRILSQPVLPPVRPSSSRARASGTSPIPQRTTPLLLSSSTSKLLVSAPRSSTAVQSVPKLQSTTSRSFFPYRRSDGGRRSGATSQRAAGLLALLAKSRGISIASSTTAASPSSVRSSSVQATRASSQVPSFTTSPSSSKASSTKTTPASAITPTTAHRRVIVKTRRPGLGGRRGRLIKPRLRGLFSNKVAESKLPSKSLTTPPPQTKLTTASNEIIDESPIIPTEAPDYQETTTKPEQQVVQRAFAFGKGRGDKSRSRSALPLGRRSKSHRSRGLASRFSGIISPVESDEPDTVSEEVTTTTTTTTTTPAPTTLSAQPNLLATRPTISKRDRDRRLPFRRRSSKGGLFQRVAEKLSSGSDEEHSRRKRQAEFGARRRTRGRGRRPVKSTTESDLDTAASDEKPAAVGRGRSRFRQNRKTTTVESTSEVPRARAVQPSPTEEKRQFTLTPNRSRSRSSGSGTRRTVPSSRSRRPSSSRSILPPSRPSSSSSPTTSSSSGGGAVSLRQRLQQARLGSSGSSSSRTSSSSRPSSSSRSSSRPSSRDSLIPRRSHSVSRPSSSGSSRTRSRPSGSNRISSSRSRPSTSRGSRPNLFGGRGGSRTSTPTKTTIAPTPVLEEGHIIVVSDNPITTSIPVVENGRSTYKEVLSASTVTTTLSPDQYTEVDIGGEIRTHVGESTAPSGNGYTLISTLFLQPTEIKTGIWTPTVHRGRQSSAVSSYIQPAFTVKPEIRTAGAQLGQQAPLGGQNNALTALLAQLLAGQTPTPALNNNFGSPVLGGGAPPRPPQQAYRTFFHTTTYVTTLTESDATTVPIFFNGRRTHTVIHNSDVQVITATEVVTTSEAIPGQTVPPSSGFGGGNTGGAGFGGLNNFGNGGGFGLTPQQLLLQQLFQQPRQQQPLFAPQPQLAPQPQIAPQPPQAPLIRPTREPDLFGSNSQPPQLEELLRQATEVSEPTKAPASSVVTLYVSGSRPGEFFTQLSTVYNDGAAKTPSRSPSRATPPSTRRGLRRRGRSRRSSSQTTILPDLPDFVPEIDSSLGYHSLSSASFVTSQAGGTQTLDSARRGATHALRQTPNKTHATTAYVRAQTGSAPSVVHVTRVLHGGVIA